MDVFHSRQHIMNPMRVDKFYRFCKTLNLPNQSKIVDIGCGKGEFLFRLFEIYKISGIGIDKSPYSIDECRRRKQVKAPEAEIRFLLMDGKDFEPDEPFDLACCLGASWIWNGIRGTLEALKHMTYPGGLIVLGEPYWKQEPSDEYLELMKVNRNSFHTHYENVLMGEDLDLTCVYTLPSDHEDWDFYETLHWWAVSEYADNNPDDPDLTEIWNNMKESRETYLRYGRETLGWCIYVYRFQRYTNFS